MSYSIGELAKLSGVSIRTLRHYDDIGLLSPLERTAAGYRRYGDEELERLRRIVGYRELGFDLARIKRILDNPAGEAEEHLRHQRASLRQQMGHLEDMLRGIDSMIEEPGAADDQVAKADLGGEERMTSDTGVRTAHWSRVGRRVVFWGVATFALGAIARILRPFVEAAYAGMMTRESMDSMGRFQREFLIQTQGVNWESLLSAIVLFGALAVAAWRVDRAIPTLNFQLISLVSWFGYMAGWSVIHGYLWEDLVGVTAGCIAATAVVGQVVVSLRSRFGLGFSGPRDPGSPGIISKIRKGALAYRNRDSNDGSATELRTAGHLG